MTSRHRSDVTFVRDDDDVTVNNGSATEGPGPRLILEASISGSNRRSVPDSRSKPSKRRPAGLLTSWKKTISDYRYGDDDSEPHAI